VASQFKYYFGRENTLSRCQTSKVERGGLFHNIECSTDISRLIRFKIT